MNAILLSALLFTSSTFVANEQSIIVPKDTKPFTVETTDLVRISAHGIAGSDITFTVNGPAKVERINRISERADGHSVIGVSRNEAEIKPTGKGKVTVTVKVKSPASPQAEEKTYEFEVQ